MRISKFGFIAVALGLAALGCASSQATPAASPRMNAQIECERGGGVWRAALNFCEYQSPGIPPR